MHKLPDDIRNDLSLKLTEVIGALNVSNNNSVNSEKFWELKELDKKLIKKTSYSDFYNYINDEPFRVYFTSEIQESIADREFKANPSTFKLTDLPDFSNPAIAAEKLIIAFENLPLEYECLIEVPFLLGAQFKSVLSGNFLKICNAFKVIEADNAFLARYPAAKVNKRGARRIFGISFSGEVLVESRLASTYLVFPLEGFMALWDNTDPFINLLLHIRSFLGLGLATTVFEYEYPFFDDDELFLRVYEKQTSGFTAKRTREMPGEVATGLRSIRFSSWANKSTLLAKASLLSIGSLFDRERDPGIERLLRAAEWLFDSRVSDDTPLSYVQAATCLEILLGDEREDNFISISKLIKNRAAYLVGKTIDDRTEIMKTFDAIYKTRSQIVHNGHNKLNSQHRNDLYSLRHLCSRVIRAEMALYEVR